MAVKLSNEQYGCRDLIGNSTLQFLKSSGSEDSFFVVFSYLHGINIVRVYHLGGSTGEALCKDMPISVMYYTSSAPSAPTVSETVLGWLRSGSAKEMPKLCWAAISENMKTLLRKYNLGVRHSVFYIRFTRKYIVETVVSCEWKWRRMTCGSTSINHLKRKRISCLRYEFSFPQYVDVAIAIDDVSESF